MSTKLSDDERSKVSAKVKKKDHYVKLFACFHYVKVYASGLLYTAQPLSVSDIQHEKK